MFVYMVIFGRQRSIFMYIVYIHVCACEYLNIDIMCMCVRVCEGLCAC